jgi:hypothetical protein
MYLNIIKMTVNQFIAFETLSYPAQRKFPYIEMVNSDRLCSTEITGLRFRNNTHDSSVSVARTISRVIFTCNEFILLRHGILTNDIYNITCTK